MSEAPGAVPGHQKWLLKAALNEQTNLSSVPPSQLKSNVISLDCHISQYATICQQLQAEVRSLARRLGTSSGLGKQETRALGAILVSCALLGL